MEEFFSCCITFERDRHPSYDLFKKDIDSSYDPTCLCSRCMDLFAEEGSANKTPIYPFLKLHAFDIYHAYALTYRHRYALYLLQGIHGSDHHALFTVEKSTFQNSVANGPLPLLQQSIEKQSRYVYDMMIKLFRPEGCGLYSSFACKTFQKAVKVAWDFRISVFLV